MLEWIYLAAPPPLTHDLPRGQLIDTLQEPFRKLRSSTRTHTIVDVQHFNKIVCPHQSL